MHKRTIGRAIRRADPSIVKRKPRLKEVVFIRVAACMSRKPQCALCSTVFMDEASLEMKRVGSKATYAQEGVDLLHGKFPKHVDKAVERVQYLVGVMDGTGALAFAT